MKTKAAICWGRNQPWEVEEVELDGPKFGEVMVETVAAGLCHSDVHTVNGDLEIPPPFVGGHEGAGVIAEVGPGVTDIAVGDPIVLSFMPTCGICAPCARGMGNLCEEGQYLLMGPQPDGTYRFHGRGQDIGQMCVLGTFAEYTVVPARSVLKVDPEIGLDKAALVSCAVSTGYGSVVKTGEVKAGDTVVVMGVGGVGMNAVQGAHIAGARHIIAVDPVEFKRSGSKDFGATGEAATVDEAVALVGQLTHGAMADLCVVTTNSLEPAYIAQSLSLVGKRGKVVVTAVAHPTDLQADISILDLTFMEKQLRGSLFGSASPRSDIPSLLDLYRTGQLKLDELITREYTLEEINQGYEDLRNGLNIRGLIRF